MNSESGELLSVATALRQWREGHGRAAPPTELQKRSVRLLQEHSWDEVCGTLGVGRSTLCSWRRSHSDEVKSRRHRSRRASPAADSGEVGLQVVEVPLPLSRLEIEVKLPSGLTVLLRGDDMHGVALGEIISRVVAEAGAFR